MSPAPTRVVIDHNIKYILACMAAVAMAAMSTYVYWAITL